MKVTGGVSVKGKIVGSKVVFTAKAKVKITQKILGTTVTLLSAGATIQASKPLASLKPCADVVVDTGLFLLTGRICIYGNKVCFENGKLYVKFQGKKHKIASIPKVCVSI